MPPRKPVSDDMKALDEAIKVAGGVAALADLIKVSHSAPSMWKKRKRVPAENCPAIERETGVPCERLNPRVAWDVVRNSGAKALLTT